MTTDRPELITMDAAECQRLLEIESFGRLAITQGTTPAIFPINYAMDGMSIVFRTAPGTKLWHGQGHPAAFEIDYVSPDAQTGWSVVATGRLEEITASDPARLRRLHQVGLRSWIAGRRNHWMCLEPGIVTGRRFQPARCDS